MTETAGGALEAARGAVDTIRGAADAATTGSHALTNPSVGAVTQAAAPQLDRLGPVDSALQGAGQAVDSAVALAQEVERRAREVAALADLARLDEARFGFDAPSAQAADWRVMHFVVREQISALYEGEVELVSAHGDSAPDELLGATAALTIARADGHDHRFRGVVIQVDDLGWSAHGQRLTRVHLRPMLWALAQRVGSRIFQDLSAVEVVTQVLTERGFELDRTLVRDLVAARSPRRAYCVQYRESELDFVQRLLEEEGIAYYVRTGPGADPYRAEVLVLVDHAAPLRPVPTLEERPVPMRTTGGATATCESLRTLVWRSALQPTSVTLRDFDFTHPAPAAFDRLSSRRPAGGDSGRDARPVYDSPAHLVPGAYDEATHVHGGGGAELPHDGARRADVRWQEIQGQTRVGHGEGDVAPFAPGFTFRVAHDARRAADAAPLLLTAVTHHGHAPEVVPADVATALGDAGRDRYWNTFACVPATAGYAPPRRTPRPIVHGAQTATVVGREGQTDDPHDDVFTDHYGRVKVRFHWDRGDQPRGTHDTAWLRVAQAWAGANWGFKFVPRIGMEVVVQFLEGDPDRPLVAGSVYNKRNEPPYFDAEAEKTISTIKTRSSPDGDGYNELRFQDAAGHEEVYLRAQHDLTELVRHHHGTHVLGSQSNAVDGSQDETIGGMQRLLVQVDRFKTVARNETVQIRGHRAVVITQTDKRRVVSHASDTIVGNYETRIGGCATTAIAGAMALGVGGAADAIGLPAGRRVVKVFETDELEVVLHRQVRVAHEHDLYGGDWVKLASPCELRLECGQALLLMHPAKATLQVGAARITVTPSKIELQVGAASITLDAAGVRTLAPEVETLATGVHTIRGVPVKINTP